MYVCCKQEYFFSYSNFIANIKTAYIKNMKKIETKKYSTRLVLHLSVFMPL
jgi:hypothetical protein